MKELSLISKILLFLSLFFFILIPRANAGYREKEYNDYFFFLEPLDPDDINKGQITTSNLTTFPIEIGNESSTITQIKLERDCNGEEDCWTYEKFYQTWNEIAKQEKTIEYMFGTQEFQSKYFTEKIEGVENRYYAHSSRCEGSKDTCINEYPDDDGAWYCIYQEDDCKSENHPYANSIYPLICSSFYAEAKISSSKSRKTDKNSSCFSFSFNI